LSNKIGTGVGITHIEEAFVKREYGIEVIGHKDSISYVN
jgi:hypothetical protein